MADNTIPPAGTEVLVYFTGTIVDRPDLGGVGAVAVHGRNGPVRRLDGSEAVQPVLSVDPGAGFRLSSRECEILELLAAARTNKQIARQLYLAPDTIKTHVKSLCQKLGATNRANAVIKAIRLGILNVKRLPRVEDDTLPELTEGQRSILPLISVDLSKVEIAKRMGLSVHRVEELEQSLRRLWGVHTRQAVVTVALENGFLEAVGD